MTDSIKQSIKPTGYKRWFTLFLVIALLVYAGVFYLFKLDIDAPPQRMNPESFLVLQSDKLPLESDDLEQRAYLFDSEPIFLPTTRNYSGPIRTDPSVWEPEVLLAAPYEVDIRWDDSLIMMETSITEELNSPTQLLEKVSRDFVSEFGVERSMPLNEKREGLYVEVKTAEGIEVVRTFIGFEETVEIDFPLNPVEFSVLVTDYGLIGEPLLTVPSGSETTDGFVREFILKNVHPILLGSTGYFRLKIGL